MWNKFLSPGDVDCLQLVKSWIPWLNFDNSDCRDVPVDSVQEHEQKIKSSSPVPTKPKEGDGVLGGLQLEGKLNSRSSPEASLHPESKGSDSVIATVLELQPEPRLSISDNSKPEVGEVSSIHVTDLERTVLRSSASVNLMPQDGGPQIKCASELDGLIRAGASLDSKPNSAGVAITIVPEPQERNSKSNASEHPKSAGGESETSFVSDSDTGCTRKSHHHLAIFISWFFGIAFLILWNAILNAGDYFYSVFPEYHPSRVFPLLYVPVALVITCWFLVLSQAQHNIRRRVLGGFAIYFVTAISIILVSAGNGFAVLGSRSTFEALCAIFILSSIGEGICGGGLFGEFSFMDPVYLQALNAGIAASGIATTGLRMITKYIFGDKSDGLRNGAMSFFAISALVHLVAIILYAFVFAKLEGVRKYRLKAVAEGSKTFRNAIVDDFNPAEEESDEKVHSEKRERQWSKADLLYENWDYVTEIIVLYAVTFSIIPGFLYENTPSNKLGTSWYPLVLLALFNGADFLSRIVRIERLFMRSRRALGVCSGCLVLLFIPGFYFGAMYTGAWLTMLLCGLLGTTNGYFTVCIFDTAPLGFKSPEQSTIGTMLYLATLLGVTIGLATDWFWLLGSTR